MYRKNRDAPETNQESESNDRVPQPLRVTDQYLALLVLVFTNAGLCDVSYDFVFLNAIFSTVNHEALISMLEESTTGSSLSRKATLLLAEVLQMANRMLPLSVAAKIQVSIRTYNPIRSKSHCYQAIPKLFGMATDFRDGQHRIIGTTAMSSIDSFNRNRARLQPTVAKTNRPRYAILVKI